MGFLEHLEEMRWRIVKSLAAVVLGALIALGMKSILFDIIIFGPIQPWFPTNAFLCTVSQDLCIEAAAPDFQALKLPTQVTVYIMTGLVSGLVIAFPYVFFQLWGFIAPGLKDAERKQARGITIWVSMLFFLGILFGYYIITPVSVQFFLNFSVSDFVKNDFTLDSYVSVVTMATLATGLLFQLPVVVLILAKLGLITPEIMKKYRKHALIAVLLLSAIITPPDITSQVLITLPLMLLYEISIMIARRVQRRAKEGALVKQ